MLSLYLFDVEHIKIVFFDLCFTALIGNESQVMISGVS